MLLGLGMSQIFQTTHIIFSRGRVQNLEAAGPLGSLLRSTDPLVDGERACCAFLKNFKPLSIFGFNFWPFGPRARIDAPDV